MTRALAAATLLIGLAIAGCGSDDSGETTAPTRLDPCGHLADPGHDDRTGDHQHDPQERPARAMAVRGPPNGTNPNLPDSATNDVAPPAGSPQEAFEKQCEQNPKACG